MVEKEEGGRGVLSKTPQTGSGTRLRTLRFRVPWCFQFPCVAVGLSVSARQRLPFPFPNEIWHGRVPRSVNVRLRLYCMSGHSGSRICGGIGFSPVVKTVKRNRTSDEDSTDRSTIRSPRSEEVTTSEHATASSRTRLIRHPVHHIVQRSRDVRASETAVSRGGE